MVSGKTIISENVFADLAKTAMTKVDHVSASNEENSTLIAIAKKVADRVAPQINVKKTDAVEGENQGVIIGHVSFEVKVTIVYGANIPETVCKLREVLVAEVESITGYQVDKVDVIVDKLVKAEEPVLEA